MLSNKEYESLYELLNSKEETLERILEKFSKVWSGESVTLFRPCFALSSFLSLNLLTKLQRIIALFLILESFKAEGVKKNPFGGLIFEIYDKTVEHYERKFICEMLLDNKRDKYAKLKLDIINEQYELFRDLYKARDEMETLRKGLVENMPKMSASKQNEVRNMLPDFNMKERRQYPPDTAFNKESIKDNELTNEAYSANFLLPLPKFIDISASELSWVSPGIICDVGWDTTYEKEKRYARGRQLLAKCETTPLTQDETREFSKLMEDYPYFMEAEFKVASIEDISIKNPCQAFDILLCMFESPRFQQVTEKILSMRLHRNTISVVTRFLTKFNIPKVLVSYYISRLIQQCSVTDSQIDRQLAFVSAFIEMVLRNDLADLKIIEPQLKDFANRFPKNDKLVAICKTLGI